eukprot:Phypoly_transcript_00286.p1 GENE.Phypoly_transcript_00286~~Phypoly_transcript_00286.p1  ORF type:complete len:986 (+),score=197.30 Phypoly_transcript_00286:2431-5388(+)
MLCAACNRSVHSRYTLALGKAWHTYHFTCFICRVVLQADDVYQETAEGITCGDCTKIKARAKAKIKGGEESALVEDAGRIPPTNDGANGDGKVGEEIDSTDSDQPSSEALTEIEKSHETDTEALYSTNFYRPRYSKPPSSSRFDFMDFSALSPSFSHTPATESPSLFLSSLPPSSSFSSSSFSLSSTNFSVMGDGASLSNSIENVLTKDSGSLNSSPRIDPTPSSGLRSSAHYDYAFTNETSKPPSDKSITTNQDDPTTTNELGNDWGVSTRQRSASAGEEGAPTPNEWDKSPPERSASAIGFRSSDHNTSSDSTNGWDPLRERSASATGWSSPHHHNNTTGWSASPRERSASANGWNSQSHHTSSKNEDTAGVHERSASASGWRGRTQTGSNFSNGTASLRERSTSATWSAPNRHASGNEEVGVSLRERSASATWSALDPHTSNNNEDTGGFSSEFYKRSYYYRKVLNVDTNHSPSLSSAPTPSPTPKSFAPTPTPFSSNPLVDAIRSRMDASPATSSPKPFTSQLDRTPPQPSPTSGLRPASFGFTPPRSVKPRYGKYAKTTFSFENPSATPEVPEEPKETPKRPQINPSNTKNKRFDFEYRDKDAPQPSENVQNTFPTEDPPNTDLYKLIDDQAYLSATLLDTNDDMNGRSRTASGARRLPPSMSIRVNVPTPSHPKKSDPRSPTSSPSPPLSLPSSPSPPLLFSSNNTSHTPPTSPRLARKPAQHTNSPPVLTPTLSRSGSPPLSLPEVPHKDIAQLIRAKIEEEVIRAVMEDAPSNTGDTTLERSNGVANGATGPSSSSLMARKRRLKQAHKEATLQRQLSLHKHLVLEVEAANGVFNLRKVVTRAGSKSSRQELTDAIRAFSITWLRKATVVENVSAHAQHMRDIRAFAKGNKRLRQVVGKTTASALLPTMTNLVWKGKQCFGVTFRDLQFLLRDPAASKDISSRLALRYRGTNEEGSAQVLPFSSISSPRFSIVPNFV